MEYLAQVLAQNAPVIVIIGLVFWKLDRRLVKIETKLFKE